MQRTLTTLLTQRSGRTHQFRGIGVHQIPDERQVELFNMRFESNVKNLLRPTAIRSANAFNMKELEMGAVLPKSRWGYTVMVDGKPVERL